MNEAMVNTIRMEFESEHKEFRLLRKVLMGQERAVARTSEAINSTEKRLTALRSMLDAYGIDSDDIMEEHGRIIREESYENHE